MNRIGGQSLTFALEALHRAPILITSFALAQGAVVCIST